MTKHTQTPRGLHRYLHLQHHTHTGKLLHHKHTSYRGLAIVFVLAAASMFGLNTMARATADTLYVTARIAAPTPTTPAVILSPVDGAVIHASPVTVSGTCPIITPRVIIAIVDNGTELGSVACDTNNEFSVSIQLSYGAHTLIARSYTITDDTGPDSDPVHITYPAPIASPAKPSTGTGKPSQPDHGTASPLVLWSQRHFLVYGPAKDALWVGSVRGGTPPYQLLIHWGDGKQDRLRLPNSDDQSISHHYGSIQPYDITFDITDAIGQKLIWHMAAISPFVPPVPSILSMWDWRPYVGLYGVYLVTLATFGYVWVRAHAMQYAPKRVSVPVAAKRRRKRT